MTAEELLVERYLKLEKKVEELEEVIEDKEELIDFQKEELSEFENLVRILSKYIKTSKYGVVSFELRNYIEEEKADIDYLANYFDVDVKEDTNGENG